VVALDLERGHPPGGGSIAKLMLVPHPGNIRRCGAAQLIADPTAAEIDDQDFIRKGKRGSRHLWRPVVIGIPSASRL